MLSIIVCACEMVDSLFGKQPGGRQGLALAQLTTSLLDSPRNHGHVITARSHSGWKTDVHNLCAVPPSPRRPWQKRANGSPTRPAQAARPSAMMQTRGHKEDSDGCATSNKPGYRRKDGKLQSEGPGDGKRAPRHKRPQRDAVPCHASRHARITRAALDASGPDVLH